MQGNVVVVGGCGHVGLPLALCLSSVGWSAKAYDTNADVVSLVNSGVMPFMEEGAASALEKELQTGRFVATTSPDSIRDADVVVVVIGTPVDEHLNPNPSEIGRALAASLPYLRDDQLIVLRSTVFPGVTRYLENWLRERELRTQVAFCPERILEGQAMTEITELPQIVGARDSATSSRAVAFFQSLGVKTVEVSPEEAELAKLFTNAWRYIKFAAANQFWMVANAAGLDFSRIHHAITYEYPRAEDLPTAGFAAGPCLFKDTAQLGAFSNNTFALGNAAMLVNEGLPLHIVEYLERSQPLHDKTVGILGMAFKGDSDDRRSSLSYKLKKLLRFKATEVLTSDPYVTTDPELLPMDKVIDASDILILAAPHRIYRGLETDKPVVDVWNLLGKGSRV